MNCAIEINNIAKSAILFCHVSSIFWMLAGVAAKMFSGNEMGSFISKELGLIDDLVQCSIKITVNDIIERYEDVVKWNFVNS